MKRSTLLFLLATGPFLSTAPAAFAEPHIRRAPTADVEKVASDTALWTLDRDAAEKKMAVLAAEWTSSAKDTLRAEKGGKIFGLDAGETLLRFDAKSGKPDNLEMSLYNRGDKGDILDKAFTDMLEKAAAAIDKVSGVKPKRFTNERSAVRPGEAVWAGKNATYVLEWSPEKTTASKRPEFVKFTIMPAGRAAAYIREFSADSTSYVKIEYNGAQHLETNAAGDKWIKDVPMVDQGQKGYCAVASTERVLRQFGLPVDQHDLAQLAQSSGDGGTDPRKLIEALRANSGKLRLNPKVLQSIDDAYLRNFVAEYNKGAHKTKAEPLPAFGSQQFYSNFSFDRLNGPALLAGRGSSASSVRSFLDKIAAQIDKGYPVMWGVMLGYAEENPKLPQAKGGHMRLIIGYNRKTNSIIYTDSWGAGHERKTMSAENAYAISEGLIVMTPK